MTSPLAGIERVIGRYRGAEPGPTLMCVAGIHGNEPAGVYALQRVFETLSRERPPARGEIVGLVGNRRALAEGRRYVAKDLNRQWTPARMKRMGTPEDGELIELRAALHDVFESRRGPVQMLDLHTTSSRSAPFTVINDTLPNRQFARHFPVPTILGFEEHVHGTIADYAHRLGCLTLGFEAGQHDDPAAVDLHEAAVRLALALTGVLPQEPTVPWTRRLSEAANGLPRYFELRDRHPLEESDSFRMLPGFENFQAVGTGQPLARNRDGVVRAKQAGRIFMPLYQDMGEDGFFLVRSVKPFWLEVSTMLRRSRLGNLVTRLPGVRPHPTRTHAVTIDPRVARWYVSEIFHLLGYQRRDSENGRLVFARRRHDPPRSGGGRGRER